MYIKKVFLIILVIVFEFCVFREIVKSGHSFPILDNDKIIADMDLRHRQETWISALEWCESRGNHKAINPKDKDGTASYFSFQFKPSTFKGYGVKYGLVSASSTDSEVMKLMEDYSLMRSIVRKMVNDPKVNFYNEFPSCVKKFVGLPPKK